MARQLPRPRRSRRSPSQRGFTLAAVIVIVTIVAMIAAYSLPKMWSITLKRERELQTIFVMKQYARAINEFQRKRGTFPVSLDQLKEQNRPRVLRAMYPDPLTGEKDDWLLIPASAMQQLGGAATPGNPMSPNPQNPYWQNPQGTGGTTAGGIGGTMNPPTGATGGSGGTVAVQAVPKDTQGPFIGVRPAKTGKSMIVFNGADSYENWTYTVLDVQREQNPQQIPITPSPQTGGMGGPTPKP